MCLYILQVIRFHSNNNSILIVWNYEFDFFSLFLILLRVLCGFTRNISLEINKNIDLTNQHDLFFLCRIKNF
jgi:hypothetical protein